ncbi:UbiC transcription regulator-associated domain protein [Streptomyces sparsogenes DSM 40356]|uniref:UbiC transcription regulator-associated domain protein n=1 Tax=Streptomyces sparsogenes DSM 40356 TaxID=1331668 RepID=A0A1R1S896_9ACTN|nr:UbiC transcription regulator-associated domain protein [Streptomyces sparsogenes DSM 40356]
MLANLGHHTHRVIEDVEARTATAEESEALALADGAPVLTLLRVSLSHKNEPIEASLMVMKGPRRLRYEMEID